MNFSTIIIIIPIIMFSVISLAIIIDRIIFFNRNRIDYNKYKKLLNNDILYLKHYILKEKKKQNIFNELILDIINNSNKKKKFLKELIDSKTSNIYLELLKRINYLGIFAKLSTLLGLFGTVIGMIISFNNIVEKGISSASIVASGISTALITTAIGLSVAIPLTFFHDYFQHKIEKEIKKIEIIISEILSLISLKKSQNKTIDNYEV